MAPPPPRLTHGHRKLDQNDLTGPSSGSGLRNIFRLWIMGRGVPER